MTTVPMAAETGPALALVGLLGVFAAGAFAAVRLAGADTPADRLLLVQLLSTKAVAGCIAVAAAFDQPALADAGLVLALLGAVAAAAFGQGGAAR